MKTFDLVLGSACAAALLGCTQLDGLTSSEGGRRHGAGTMDTLTSAEQSAHRADQQYIHDLAKPGARIRLNFADSRQYRFALARLRLAGKDADSSPDLFELVEAHRQEHLARELRPGTFAEELTPSSVALEAVHRIERADVRRLNATTTLVEGTASSTYGGAIAHAYVDLAITATDGVAVGPLVYEEKIGETDGPRILGMTVDTNATTTSKLARYAVSSYRFEVSPEGFIGDYVYAELGITEPSPATGLIPRPPQAGAVLQETGAPPYLSISICIDRTWTNDCDYTLAD
jgi:hypothetical protein